MKLNLKKNLMPINPIYMILIFLLFYIAIDLLMNDMLFPLVIVLIIVIFGLSAVGTKYLMDYDCFITNQKNRKSIQMSKRKRRDI